MKSNGLSALRAILLMTATFFLVPGPVAVAVAQDKDEAEKKDPDDLIGALRLVMQPFNISIYEKGKIVSRANIEIVLEAKDLDWAEEVKLRAPQLRADFYTALTELARDRFRLNRRMEADLIKRYVTAYADRRLGQKGLVEVFVVQAYLQPL